LVFAAVVAELPPQAARSGVIAAAPATAAAAPRKLLRLHSPLMVGPVLLRRSVEALAFGCEASHAPLIRQEPVVTAF
jgi:hypothetical protein